MLRSIRIGIARLIASNRLTRGIMLRLALDERILPSVLSSDIIYYRLSDNAKVRDQIQILAQECGTPSSSSVSPEALFVEPGMGKLHAILSNPRTLDVIASDRTLLRKILRNPRELKGVADEVAQFGPLLVEVLNSASGRTALKHYLESRRDSEEAHALAQQLTELMLDNGAVQMAVQSDESVCESVKSVVSGR